MKTIIQIGVGLIIALLFLNINLTKIYSLAEPTAVVNGDNVKLNWAQGSPLSTYTLLIYDAECVYCMLPEEIRYSEETSIELRDLPSFIRTAAVHLEGFGDDTEEAILYPVVKFENPNYDPEAKKPERKINDRSNTPDIEVSEEQSSNFLPKLDSFQKIIIFFVTVLVAFIVPLLFLKGTHIEFKFKRKNN